MKGSVYMIPTPLGSPANYAGLSGHGVGLLAELKTFAVESEKEARRAIVGARKHLGVWDGSLEGVALVRIAAPEVWPMLKQELDAGQSVGVVSDAGCPGLADPGPQIARLAHAAGIRVVPVAGPSAIVLAVMASGMNGQQFTFHGYLPRQPAERKKAVTRLEHEALKSGYTQIFIETPYRNAAMLHDLLATLRPDTRLCVAAHLTAPDEWVVQRRVAEWKASLCDISKVPAIFLIGS